MITEWTLTRRIELPISRLDPQRILLEFEEPWVFLSEPWGGSQMLVYFSEEVGRNQVRRNIVAPTNGIGTAQLESGEITLFDALTRSWLWVVDVDLDGRVVAIYNSSVDELPERALPPKDMMLHAGLEPAITLRFEGEDLREGSIPANVLQEAGAAVQDALKPLSKFVTDKELPGGGRRTDYERALYNLSAQRIAFGSLEVSFRRRDPTNHLFAESKGSPEATEREMWAMLRKGLRWLSSSEEPPKLAALEAESDEERHAILVALQALVPSTSSVTRVSVGGRFVSTDNPAKRFTLSKRDAKTVRSKTTEVQERLQTMSESRVYSGWVRELNLDERSIELRQVSGSVDTDPIAATIEPDDDESFLTAKEAHYFEYQVELVVSRERRISDNKSTAWVVRSLNTIPSKDPLMSESRTATED